MARKPEAEPSPAPIVPVKPGKKLTKREREAVREERLMHLAETVLSQPSALALLTGAIGGVALYYPLDFMWTGTDQSYIGADPTQPRTYYYRVHLSVDNIARAAAVHLPVPFTTGTVDFGLPSPRDITILVTRLIFPGTPEPTTAEIVTEAQLRAALIYSVMGAGTGAALTALAGSLSTMFRKG